MAKKKKTKKRKRKAAVPSTRLNKTIGKRVRKERQGKELTIREVADHTGLTASQLSQVELGKNAASIAALVRIAKALRVRPAHLLSDL